MEITKTTVDGENVYKTNIKNLKGHLTYSNGNTILEKELEYTDNITKIDDNLYLIPPVSIRAMKNSTVLLPGSATTDFTIGGSTDSKLVEVSGYFSYIISTENLHHNSKKVDKPNVSVETTRAYTRALNFSNTTNASTGENDATVDPPSGGDTIG